MFNARSRVVAFCAVALVIDFGGRPARAAEPSLRGIGLVPGAELSTAAGVSADGRTVVGAVGNWGVAGIMPYRWTAEGGMVTLGGLDLGPAAGVSTDGSVVVGQGIENGTPYAWRWTQAGGVARLPNAPGEFQASGAVGVSGDGSTVVGYTNPDGGETLAYWRNGTVTSIGALLLDPTRDTGPRATGASSDGSVVAGYSHSPRGLYEALRWTVAGGMQPLGDLPGGDFYSAAAGISSDGSTVVGVSKSAFGDEPFRWTAGSGMVSLTDLAPGSARVLGSASAVSADGSVVVGAADVEGGIEAFLWDGVRGARSLKSELQALGVDVAGWRLEAASGVSADGTTIVGNGWTPGGEFQAFIAVVPEPGVVAWGPAVAAAALMLRWRRSGRSR